MFFFVPFLRNFSARFKPIWKNFHSGLSIPLRTNVNNGNDGNTAENPRMGKKENKFWNDVITRTKNQLRLARWEIEICNCELCTGKQNLVFSIIIYFYDYARVARRRYVVVSIPGSVGVYYRGSYLKNAAIGLFELSIQELMARRKIIFRLFLFSLYKTGADQV